MSRIHDIAPSRPVMRGGIFVVAVVIAWDIAARLGWLGGRNFFPPASDVFVAWWQMTATGELAQAFLVTLAGYLKGFAIAGVLGVLLGVWIARSPTLAALASPIVEFLRPMPSVAVIPLAILFFGIDDAMKAFVAAYGALWPVLLNTIYGVRSVDSRLLEVARIFRFGELRTLLLVVIPAASPFILTGLRLGSILTLGLVVTAELVAGGNGIGHVIQQEQLAFKVPQTFAGVLTVMVLGLLVDHAMALLETYAMGWHLRSLRRGS